MKKFPKVPRYDHPVIRQKDLYLMENIVDRYNYPAKVNPWFGSSAVAIEKFDGSQFRFMIYDEQFEDKYDFDGEHKELFIGTKNYADSSNNINNFQYAEDLELRDRVEYLNNNLDKDQIIKYHEELGHPLVFYAENMVKHTIEEYDWQNIPDLIGFDIYKVGSEEDNQDFVNPYKQLFYGFLEWKEVKKIMNDIGLETPQVVKEGVLPSDLTDSIIPKSEFGDVEAEGVVVRNDTTKRRLKYRRKSFIEMHRKVTGVYDMETDPHEKIIAFKYGTNQRIRETIQSSETPNEYDDEYFVQLASDIISDIWIEEYMDIIRDNINIKELHEYLGERIKNYITSDSVFSNDFEDELVKSVKEWDVSFDNELESISDPNTHIVYKFITENTLNNHTETILQDEDKELGKWIIDPLGKRLFEWLITEHRNFILNIDGTIRFSKIQDNIYADVVKFIEENTN